MIYKFDNEKITFNDFFIKLNLIKTDKLKFSISDRVLKKINTEFEIIKNNLNSSVPVYGINTGLGGNLNYKLQSNEVSNFQDYIIKGRAVSAGNYLSQNIGLKTLLARCIQTSRGKTGISPGLLKFFLKCLEEKIDPAIPEFGSIGSGDLTQNASFGLSLIGKGQVWQNNKIRNSKSLFKSLKLKSPKFEGKDAMVLINHSCLSLALSAQALYQAKISLMMLQFSSLLSIEAFQANIKIFSPEINRLRYSPNQKECANWFYNILNSLKVTPRRIQDPLSFRTISVCHGLAITNIKQSISYWENELNSTTDSPVVLGKNKLYSTPNFHNPALSHSMENIMLSNTTISNGSVQRMQRLMDSKLSGLNSYLSPVGGKSAGFAPSQKTAASILAEIRHLALPISFDASPVSDSVEDMSTMTPSSAKKLIKQSQLIKLISGMECLVACQALDMRYENVFNSKKISQVTKNIWKNIRNSIDKISDDRPMENDINTSSLILEEFVKGSKTKNNLFF